MPKVPIDYAKTIIYKLVHKDDLNDENIYTGHTTDMRVRKNLHKSDCNNPNSDKYNQKNYKYIRENGGWDEWLMIEIEKYPCNDVNEAIARERVIQAEMKAKLNDNVPGRTKKEWGIDKREKLSEKRKQYYQDNRESILEKVSNYVQNNRDKVLENKKQYYQDNRENLAEKAKQKITCDHCGSIVRIHGIQKHKRTQKCINFKPA